MATFKASMLLQITTNPDKTFTPIERLGGWSESWFYTAATPALVLPRLTTLGRLRAQMLPATGSVVGFRVQQVNPVGASQSFPAFSTGGTLATDIPQACLLCRAITSNGLNARQVKIAGIPDARVINGEYQPSSAFTAALNAYFAEVIAHWQMQGIDRSQPVQVVSSVTIGGLVTFAGAHGLVAGDSIRFFRTKDANGKTIKGTWLVQEPINTLTVTLAGWKGQVVGMGRARKIVTTYPSMGNGSITVQRVITRKVGRGFFPYRGRASARR